MKRPADIKTIIDKVYRPDHPDYDQSRLPQMVVSQFRYRDGRKIDHLHFIPAFSETGIYLNRDQTADILKEWRRTSSDPRSLVKVIRRVV